ncbi:MAG TPA: superoxide dismutase family protein [Burkholderiaceae bacterium]|nr:superoxide dismutase family protein [Burkholderiaceae bacterium]
MRTILGIAIGTLLLAGCAGMSAGPTAVAKLEPRSGSQVSGNVIFTQVGEMVRISGEVTGHTAGIKGWHIHEKSDCSDPKAMSAGSHFNPRAHTHGGPTDSVRHAGDLGNLVFNDRGSATINATIGGLSVSRDKPDGIIGRALIIHMDQDDLKTDPTGNAGGRAACGVIQG